MSFASDIKDEVVRIRVRDGAVKLSELSGLTFACGNLKLGRKKAISYRTENREVGRHIAALGASLYDLDVEMEERVREHRKAPLYVVNMSGPRAGEMLSDTGVMVTDEEGVHLLSRLPEGLVQEDEARRAFVRGCFLGAGSCSDPQGEYSVEILCRTESFAGSLADLLTQYGLTARYALRRNRYVVYLKEGDSVTGFLALIGSNIAALDLENVRAEKETRNYVNRTTNCEYANLDKLVAATYEDKVKGAIPEAVCIELLNKYQSERNEKTSQLTELKQQMESAAADREDIQAWADLIRQYRDLESLDRETVLRLIDHIEIGEKKIVNGQKEQEIRIHYKFVGYIG